MKSERTQWIGPALALAVAAAALAPSRADDGPDGAGSLSEEETRLNLESFDVVWETIRDTHFDPDLNGVDWEAAREELRPEVAGAESMAEARDAMRALLEKLGQSHFGIIPGSVAEAIEAPERDGDGAAGLHVRVVDGEGLVVRVDPDSAAEAAGVRPGWIVEDVEGEAIAPVLERVVEAYGDSPSLALYGARAVERRFGGRVGQERSATFRDGDGEEVEVTLTLGEPRGDEVRFGNIDGMRVVFDSEVIDGDIPYLRWSTFFDPVRLQPKIGDAITDDPDAPGVILDLRGNPGGIGAMAMGIGGWLFEDSGQVLGTMSMRNTDLKFVIFPRPETYTGPVAVLVDGCSASTSEIFAGGLQDLGRARVFGTATAGAALPSAVTELPNGDRFQFAIANYVSADGEPLEGEGVTPDEVTPPDREALLRGRDPALDAAVEWIRSRADG